MATWQDLSESAPELAKLVADRFASTGLVMLGTVRANGWPRITPIEYTIWQGELVLGGMWQSKKCLDLLRDGRCTLHSTTSDKNGQQGDAKLFGYATPLAPEREEGYWEHIYSLLNWRPEGPAHVFTIEIQSAAYVVFDQGSMRLLRWPGPLEWKVTHSH